jgi:hypothetical protein
MSDSTRAGETGDSAEGGAKHFDVLIAAYLFVDPARKDYDAVMKLVEDKVIRVGGVILVNKDHAGQLHVVEAGDHLVRHGAEVVWGSGIGGGFVCAPAARSNGHWRRGRCPDRQSLPSTGSKAVSRRR